MEKAQGSDSGAWKSPGGSWMGSGESEGQTPKEADETRRQPGNQAWHHLCY